MSANLISLATPALRNPFLAAVGGVRAVQPVVEKASSRASFNPPERTDSRGTDKTIYTPGSPRDRSVGLYSPKGTLRPTESTFRSVSVERDQSFDLTIKTAQGDIATLSFSQQQSFNTAVNAQQSRQGATLAMDFNQSTALNMQVAVQGDLDAQEMASITELANRMGAVADDFFTGDMQQAIGQAQRLAQQGPPDTLSAFSFELQSQETRRAVATYESVAAATQAPPASSPFLQSPLTLPTAPIPGNASHTSGPQNGGSFMKHLLALFDGVKQNAKDALQAPPPVVGREPSLVIDV